MGNYSGHTEEMLDIGLITTEIIEHTEKIYWQDLFIEQHNDANDITIITMEQDKITTF